MYSLTAFSHYTMDSPIEHPGDALDSHSTEDYAPLGETIPDRYGCRRRAWRHNISGKMTTETALSEATTTYKPQLNFFRRQDNMNCLPISIFCRHPEQAHQGDRRALVLSSHGDLCRILVSDV